ncbi:TPA: hypothetical protein JA361_15080 [Legionella pneumophila]|nr:hypothetical protein [Legionella pneumophila]HAT8181281.1 hypothetical protein [Legionella pneumophila]
MTSVSFNSIKLIWIASLISIIPTLSYPESNIQYQETLQSHCLETWLNNADQSIDKETYKQFGDKYCRCISTKNLDNKTGIQKAIKNCLPQTILHDAMDELEEEVTLSEVTTQTIEQYCLNRWSLIYPNQSDEDKKTIQAYCACVKTKLLNFIEQIEKISNKEYNEAINDINTICSENLNQ